MHHVHCIAVAVYVEHTMTSISPASPGGLLSGVCCSSVVRHFRYAATLTACQLVSSWIRTMQTLNDARETAQRQLDAEGKKKSCKVCTLKHCKEMSSALATHNGALCTQRQPGVYTLNAQSARSLLQSEQSVPKHNCILHTSVGSY